MARVSNDIYLAVVTLRIRKVRGALGLLQEDVAALAGTDPRHYRRVEALTGKRANPTLALLRSVALALNTDVSALTGEPTEEEVAELEVETSLSNIGRDGEI